MFVYDVYMVQILMQEFFKDVSFDKCVDWQYVSREREYEVNEMYVFIVLYYWVFILCYYVNILCSQLCMK